MIVYLDAVALLNFLVDYLLLLGTNRLCGYPANAPKALPAAALGGIYGGACLLPGFGFLGSGLWRCVFLVLMVVLAFGISGLRRGVVFLLLSMALSGIVALGDGSAGALLLAAVGISLMCVVGLGRGVGRQSFLPVELSYGGKKMQIFALQDTGNTLRDPISGAPVLVVGADVAQALTGLTENQLRQPVESMGILPGLRLIPYRTVGQNSGMLLALRLPYVKIGTWQGSTLVAFSPESFGRKEEFQALTGGAI